MLLAFKAKSIYFEQFCVPCLALKSLRIKVKKSMGGWLVDDFINFKQYSKLSWTPVVTKDKVQLLS